MSRLRIISGEFGGRFIKAPQGRTTHPMSDRVRQSLFNRLDLRGKKVLDVFAGSGSLGLEALSRGAISADFVEKDRAAQNIILENIQSLGVTDKAKVYKMPVHSFITNIGAKLDEDEKYDVIFIDPPYHFFQRKDYFSTALEIKGLAKRNGLMVLSYPGRLRVPTVKGVVVVVSQSYGDAALAVFRLDQERNR